MGVKAKQESQDAIIEVVVKGKPLFGGTTYYVEQEATTTITSYPVETDVAIDAAIDAAAY